MYDRKKIRSAQNVTDVSFSCSDDESCILYRLYCFGRLLLWLHCLRMFACLMILFADRTIKYAKEFSMKC